MINDNCGAARLIFNVSQLTNNDAEEVPERNGDGLVSIRCTPGKATEHHQRNSKNGYKLFSLFPPLLHDWG